MRVESTGDRTLQPAIEFEELGLTISLDGARDHFRNDGLVDDLAAHQAAVLAEFGQQGLALENTNPALNGRTLTWTDEQGSWAISFARSEPDERLARARLVHEEVHALSHLAPERLGDLYLAIEERGFALDWGAHDEELRATLVEIVALHGSGVPLEALSGSELLVRGVEILKAARERAR